MFHHIAFDMGGVLFTLRLDNAVRHFEEIGLTDASKRLGPYGQTGIFADLETGRIDRAAFRSELSALIGHEVSFEDCLYGWRGFIGAMDQKYYDYLDMLKREGFRLYLVSNTNPFLMAWMESHTPKPFSTYFDAVYASCEQKIMKPDPAIFQNLLDEQHISGGDLLFVDDGPVNCRAAEHLGIHTYCPAPGHDWRDDVSALIGRDPSKETIY